MKKYKIAIVGATGLVGRTLLKVLEEKNFKNLEYSLFASSKSQGSKISFNNTTYTILELNEKSFDSHFDYALFCVSNEIAKKYVPIAVKNGTIVIDNSSYYRMDPTVPLVVPEVNPKEIFKNNGIISNPNCSTIQAIVPLKVLDDNYSIKRIIFTTYQAVSGAGINGIYDLENKTTNANLRKFPYQIYNNCIPHIDYFEFDGYTKEEHKMINETRKILNKKNLPITATCVRVPVVNCHSESINVELEKDFDLHDMRILLENSPGIIVADNPSNNIYPICSKVNGNNEIYVGRIRRDYSVENGLNFWVVADNLRKGAATNSVQILEKLIYN